MATIPAPKMTFKHDQCEPWERKIEELNDLNNKLGLALKEMCQTMLDHGLNKSHANFLMQEFNLNSYVDKGIGRYFIKSKKYWSPVKDDHVRLMFESIQKKKGWKLGFDRGLSGIYDRNDLQLRWEEFYAGFREAEEST